MTKPTPILDTRSLDRIKPIDAESMRQVFRDQAMSQFNASGAVCKCCGLPVSDEMRAKSFERYKNSTKKPAYQIPSGFLKDSWICKQCYLETHFSTLSLANSETVEQALDEYRAAVTRRYLTFFTNGDPVLLNTLRVVAFKMNLEPWQENSRIPKYANAFWILMKLLRMSEVKL